MTYNNTYRVQSVTS